MTAILNSVWTLAAVVLVFVIFFSIQIIRDIRNGEFLSALSNGLLLLGLLFVAALGFLFSLAQHSHNYRQALRLMDMMPACGAVAGTLTVLGTAGEHYTAWQKRAEQRKATATPAPPEGVSDQVWPPPPTRPTD